MRKLKIFTAIFLTLAVIVFCVGFGVFFFWKRTRVYEPLSEIRTLKSGKDKQIIKFKDPFGVAVSNEGTIYISDGDDGKIWAIDEETGAKVIAESLDTPSGIAISNDGNLIVADSGDHTIKKVDVKSGAVSFIAGTKGKFGFKDGKSSEVLFNGPVGVAVGKDGTIYVADTYNDRIRLIDNQGQVKTIAGGDSPDYVDSPDGLSARFDSPCGIALLKDDSVIVADTGNNLLRRIDKNGSVTTFAKDGLTTEQTAFQFHEPVGITIAGDETIYVADTGSAAIRTCKTQPTIACSSFAGSDARGIGDGAFAKVRFNRPSNIAIAYDGKIIIADTGNGLIRIAVGKGRELGSVLSEDEVKAMRPKSEEFRTAAPPRWPYDPPERTREIAATFGEVRGALEDQNGEAWYHNGLDIPGPMGEKVRSVRTEKNLLILPVSLFETKRENFRLPTMGYVHVNVGRDLEKKNLDENKFLFRYDKDKKLSGVRVRRGTKFNAGDVVGTLNSFYHVHLIAGRTGGEMNALAALELPGITDAVAPTIEANGITFFDKDWNEIKADKKSPVMRIPKSAPVRIVVKAYDQMDGNASRRKLGAYKLGYQILKADGSAAEGFSEPNMTISFERLPRDWNANRIYAKGSQADGQGETIFSYIVTNSLKDGEAQEGFWETSKLSAGDYIVRIFVEDFFSNRKTQDVKVKVD